MLFRSTPLTRAELDAAAPNNPVYLQFSRCCAFMNTKGAEAMGLAAMKEPWVERDASGKPTGRINDPGLAQVAAKLPKPPKDTFPTNANALLLDLNRAGLTTAGISGCPAEATEYFREQEKKGALNFRFMCMVSAPGFLQAGAPTPPDQIQRMVAQIKQIKLFQGDNYMDDVMYGESIAYSDNMMQAHTSYTAEQRANWTALAMNDAGINGDETAGDGVYSVTVPPQANRTLVRYRITCTDSLGAARRAPFEDDPSLNFAWFVYNGVPDYLGFPAATLQTLDRKSTRLNSSHIPLSRMPSSA